MTAEKRRSDYSGRAVRIMSTHTAIGTFNNNTNSDTL